MRKTSVISIFLLNFVTVSYIQATTVFYGPQSCPSTINLTANCLREEITLMHSAALAIHGNIDNECDPLISEQTCQLCQLFNRTKMCLDMLLGSCNYTEIYQFLWTYKVPYLGTISSLCHQRNLVAEIYENLECYNGITWNLRKCFNAVKRPLSRSCGDVNSAYTCVSMISKAYCAVLFQTKSYHKDLSSLYIRSIQPLIDLQNCTKDSQLFLGEVYPEYQYLWKETTTEVKVQQETNGTRLLHAALRLFQPQLNCAAVHKTLPNSFYFGLPYYLVIKTIYFL